MKIVAWSLSVAALVSAFAMSSAITAQAESVLSPDGKVRTFLRHGPTKILDPAKAKPLRLPVNPRPLPNFVDMAVEAAKQSSAFTPGRVFPGGAGSGAPAGVRFAQPAPVVTATSATGGGVGPQDYGTSGQPYTMARAPGVTISPYRQAGLLIFNDGGSNPVTCSAALVKPGIVVTAAHCIVPYGSTTNYTNFLYLPAYNQSASSYGVWTAGQPSVLASWTGGTDSCGTAGTVCKDDVGVLTLEPQNNAYLGAQTGWFGYSTNNYSYKAGQVEVTQLGYSSSYDGGVGMLRTDSQGSVGNAKQSNNTIIGSPLGDGSDGGPWVVNLGTSPAIDTSQWSHGFAYAHNIIVGVTSWSTVGSHAPPRTTPAQKQAGASPFLPSNIGVLVSNACSTTPAAC